MQRDAPKSGKYSHVGSKVSGKVAESATGPRKEFLKSGQGSPGGAHSTKRGSGPRGFGFGATDRGLEAKENSAVSRASPVEGRGTMNVPHQLGTMPKYLSKRKTELQQKADAERKARELEESDCPPGMRPMDADEVAATLKILQENRSAITQECRRMPLKLETEGQKRRGMELENKLREIEEAIKIFSRPVVYCKDD